MKAIPTILMIICAILMLIWGFKAETIHDLAMVIMMGICAIINQNNVKSND